jgi:hypothetical protein
MTQDYNSANERANHYKKLNEEGENQLLEMMKVSSSLSSANTNNSFDHSM